MLRYACGGGREEGRVGGRDEHTDQGGTLDAHFHRLILLCGMKEETHTHRPFSTPKIQSQILKNNVCMNINI